MSQSIQATDRVQELTDDEIDALIGRRTMSEWVHQQDVHDLLMRLKIRYSILLNEARMERDIAGNRVKHLERELVQAKLSLILGEL